MYAKNLKLQDLEHKLQDLLTFYRDNGEKLDDSFSVKVTSVDKTINITLTRKFQPFYEKIAGKPYEFYWTMIRKVFNQMQIKGFNRLVIAANFENIHPYDWERQNAINEETGKVIPTDLDKLGSNFRIVIAVFFVLGVTVFSMALISNPNFLDHYWQIACSNNIVSQDASTCKK